MSRRQRVQLPFKDARKAGQVVCVWCGGPVPSHRHRWCSRKCVLTYQIARGDQGAARLWLQWADWDLGALREPLPCEKCGLDMCDGAVEERIRVDAQNHQDPIWHRKARWADEFNWDADHRIPLAEGGAKHPDNLRVLCRPCHKAETAALRKRLAEARRAAR